MKLIFLCTIFVSGFLLNTSAQQVIINDKPGQRLLTWDDFKGRPDESASHGAYTYWNLSYKYAGTEPNGENVSFKDLELTLKFDIIKSWVKETKATPELLKHEQGHFELGRLCQLEILSIVKKTSFDKTGFQLQFKAIFKNTLEKYKALGLKYDEETNHSLNKEKQEEWNNFFRTEKERMLKLNQ